MASSRYPGYFFAIVVFLCLYLVIFGFGSMMPWFAALFHDVEYRFVYGALLAIFSICLHFAVKYLEEAGLLDKSAEIIEQRTIREDVETEDEITEDEADSISDFRSILLPVTALIALAVGVSIYHIYVFIMDVIMQNESDLKSFIMSVDTIVSVVMFLSIINARDKIRSLKILVSILVLSNLVSVWYEYTFNYDVDEVTRIVCLTIMELLLWRHVLRISSNLNALAKTTY